MRRTLTVVTFVWLAAWGLVGCRNQGPICKCLGDAGQLSGDAGTD